MGRAEALNYEGWGRLSCRAEALNYEGWGRLSCRAKALNYGDRGQSWSSEVGFPRLGQEGWKNYIANLVNNRGEFVMDHLMLKIDLSNRSYDVEEIPKDVIRKYIGGRGLGSYLLSRFVPAGADPLGEENHLIFTAGPASGSGPARPRRRRRSPTRESDRQSAQSSSQHLFVTNVRP